jgi:hypothetical protein
MFFQFREDKSIESFESSESSVKMSIPLLSISNLNLLVKSVSAIRISLVSLNALCVCDHSS